MISFADTAGGANAFLALLMLESVRSPHGPGENRTDRTGTVMRYGIAVLDGCGLYSLRPSDWKCADSGNCVPRTGGYIAPAFTGL